MICPLSCQRLGILYRAEFNGQPYHHKTIKKLPLSVHFKFCTQISASGNLFKRLHKRLSCTLEHFQLTP